MATDSLTQFFQGSFFASDSLFHAGGAGGGQFGVAGDPIPYSASRDDVITTLLILGFVMLVIAISRNFSFLSRQVRNFFYEQKGDHTMTETGNEIRLQLILVFITCLSYAMLSYFYVTNFITSTFILDSEYLFLLILLAVFVAFYVLRFTLYSAVNSVFFDSAKNKKFLTDLLFISSVEGCLLFPLTLLLVYFQYAPQNALIYCAAVLILVKFLTIYKTYIIFFRQKAFFLQIILYFCTLEMVPLFSLLGGLAVIVKSLKVIF